MAFFEQLGKKIADAGQGVAQQTKNFTDTTRLNSAISEKEKRIAQLYANIGRGYYERHKNDSSAEELSLIAEINSLNSEILQCREEIKQIKGVVKCTNCGKDIPLNAAFCSFCAAPAPKAEAPLKDNRVKCGNCGAMVQKGMRFCTACGKPLAQEAPIAEAPAEEAPAAEEVREAPAEAPSEEAAVSEIPARQEPTQQTSETEIQAEEAASRAEPAERLCPKCGEKAEDGTLFCTECGTRL